MYKHLNITVQRVQEFENGISSCSIIKIKPVIMFKHLNIDVQHLHLTFHQVQTFEYSIPSCAIL